jgi:hypothetical protein
MTDYPRPVGPVKPAMIQMMSGVDSRHWHRREWYDDGTKSEWQEVTATPQGKCIPAAH